MPLPNFLIGGTEPAGLNFLFSCLRQHPAVYLPPFLQPEPNFFSKEAEHARGLEHYERRYFHAWAGQPAVGEKSGRYLFSADAPARIRAALPGARLIFILRDPVERAHSNWRFTAQAGFEWLAFEAALAVEEERTAADLASPRWREVLPRAYFRKGLYAEQLERYLALFPREQVLLLQSEALRQDARPHLRRAFEFLGVDPALEVDLASTSDYPSCEVRSLRLQRLLRRLAPAHLDRAIMTRREGRAGSFLERLVHLNLSTARAPLAAAARQALQARYAEPNRRLAALAPELRLDLWG
ncbi:MAG: sulfotransferase [Planctomycetota bacterium]|nr:sulfotransferase [Planctomycetota bacterium]